MNPPDAGAVTSASPAELRDLHRAWRGDADSRHLELAPGRHQPDLLAGHECHTAVYAPR